MHNVGVSTGDSYLQSFLVGTGTVVNPAPGSLLASKLFQPGQKTVLALWWDEYDPSPQLLYSPTLLSSSSIDQGNNYDEYSWLHMIEINWALPTLTSNDAAAATPSLFGTPPPPTVDYSLLNNGPVTIQAGNSGTVTVTSTLKAGTAQPVTLSCVSSLLPAGITCGSFTVNPVTPTAAGATSVLTINVISTVAAGSHTFQVTGSPLGNTTTPSTVSVTVTAPPPGQPDFSLSANPTSVSFPVGGTAASTITMVPLGGFTGTVGLNVTSPTGATTACSPIALSGTAPTSTCTFSALSAASGTVIISGTSGALSHSASISFVSTAPCTVGCGQGPVPYLTGWGAVKLAEVETTTGGVNDFEAHLQLLQKMGYNAVRVEWQSPCVANEGSGAYSNADFQAAAALAKKYNIWLIMDWLSGTDLGSSCWLNNWQSIVSYANSNINYTQIIWEPENEPMSSVGITQLTSGYQAFLNMARQMGDNRWVVVSNLCIQTCESNPSPGGWPVVNDTAHHVFMDWHSYMYYPYWYGQGWTNAVADTAANFDYQFTLSALQVCSWCKLINTEIGADPIGGSPPDATPSGASGDTCDGYTAVTVHFVQDLVNLFKSANISWTGWGIGSWLTNVCGSNSFEGNLSGQISYGALQSPLGWGLQLTAGQVGPDFGLSASPSSVSVSQGAAGTSVITLTSLNSFNGTVALSGAPPLSSISVTASPSSLALTAAGQGASTLTISTTSSTPVGGYTVTVTGTSGGLSHSVTVTFTVSSPPPAPDFAISSSQVTLTIVQGSSRTSTITLTSLSGFAGTISLTSSVSTSSATASLGASSVTLSTAGSGTVTLTVSTVSSTPAGTFSARVTGASGSLSHSVTISVTVTLPPDFGLAASPSSISIPSGSSGSVTLTLTSLNGFTGSLSLAETASPSGIASSLSTSSPTLSSGGQTGSTLTISPSGLVSPGTYILSLTGTGSGLSHSIAIPITVTVPVIQPLQGALSWGPTAAVAGQTVTFTARATNGVQPYSFAWDFGDGSTGSGATLSHAYSRSGTYTVKLVIVDGSSITVTVQNILNIGAASTALTLVTVPGPETAPLGSILSFSVNASNPSGQGPISISATNLPPGASFTSTSGNPAAGTFSWTPASSVQPGLYTVTFNAVQAGSSYSASKSVAINVSAAASGGQCLFLCQVPSEVWSLLSLVMIGGTVGLLLTAGMITFSRVYRSRPRGLPLIPIPRLSMPSRVSVSPLYGSIRNPYGSPGHKITKVRKPTSRRVLREKIHTQSSAFEAQTGSVRPRRKLR